MEARPPFSFCNEVDCGRVYSRNNRKRISGDSKSQRAPNVYDLSLSQFMPGCIFSAQVNKSGSPLVSGVVRQRYPLEVFWSVIQFVAVDMVHRQFRRIPLNKSHSNQAMHKNLWSFVAKFCGNNMVTASGKPRGYSSFWPNASKLLQFSFTNTRGVRDNLWPCNTSVWVNQPVNAFFVYKFWGHVVNYTAGHRLEQL